MTNGQTERGRWSVVHDGPSGPIISGPGFTMFAVIPIPRDRQGFDTEAMSERIVAAFNAQGEPRLSPDEAAILAEYRRDLQET